MSEVNLKLVVDTTELKKLVHDLVGQMAPLVEAIQKEGVIGGGTGAGFGKDCAQSPFGNGICVGVSLSYKPEKDAESEELRRVREQLRQAREELVRREDDLYGYR